MPLSAENIAFAKKLTQDLADRGLLVAAGWQTYRLLCLGLKFNESDEALQEAYEVGVEHMFSCVINMLDPGEEPTEQDLTRMEMIFKEIEPIQAKLRLKYGRTAGQA